MISEKLLEIYGYNEPIFASEILEVFDNFTKAYVYRLLDKEVKEKQIIKFSQGVYYIPCDTPFGRSIIDASQVAYKKYINDKGTYKGIISGLSMQNAFQLTTQMPNKIEIITNDEATRKRVIEIDGMTYILKKSRIKITNSNVHVYRLLELFTQNDLKLFNDDAYKSINQYIKTNNIKKTDIVDMLKYFPSKTSKRLISSSII